ncbi:hypothetical protein AXF42_Ash019671 [Apostasia shenzhenica]|uniref:Helitron helicase-like domain-containing protein n=1 Tax=Apostasia shenzhenica TaxID=1088818 RepID=A0A2H9ZTS7_9ASPA|nr:hypothetical protein AXF42_Ash019671 [Apostasia shenzhenica]
MVQNYQDAMSICAWAGPPDLFITFTCNPNWNDIHEFLQYIQGQQPNDRPDILSRVFNLKMKQICDDLILKRQFGKLQKDCKFRNIEEIDHIIKAEIPDKEKEPLLHKLVIKYMIHGPCGYYNPKASCMKNEKCSKGFPKNYNNYTHINENGFPLYKRAEGSPSA